MITENQNLTQTDVNEVENQASNDANSEVSTESNKETKNEYTFGGIKIVGEDPEGIKKAQESYRNLQKLNSNNINKIKELEAKLNGLSSQKSPETQNVTENNKEQTPLSAFDSYVNNFKTKDVAEKFIENKIISDKLSSKNLNFLKSDLKSLLMKGYDEQGKDFLENVDLEAAINVVRQSIEQKGSPELRNLNRTWEDVFMNHTKTKSDFDKLYEQLLNSKKEQKDSEASVKIPINYEEGNKNVDPVQAVKNLEHSYREGKISELEYKKALQKIYYN